MASKRERAAVLAIGTGAILLGNLLLAAATAFFVIPLGLVTAGTTGIALFINRLTGFSVTAFTYLFYTGSFAVGCASLGRRFALTTALSSLWYPIAFSICERIAQGRTVTSNTMLGTLAAGLMMGFGIGLVLRAGASTGGTDVPLLILQRYLHVPISIGVWALDLVILLMQALTVSTEMLLFGFILVAIYSAVIGRVMLLGRSMIWATVITEKPALLRDRIYRELDRGVTLLHGQTGYLERECDVLLTVIPARELGRLERTVSHTAPDAFLIVHRVSEVRGVGFLPHK